MLLLTLRGTPTLYYGDEIGMRDVPIPPDRVQDPFEKNVPGLGLGRDPQRTPMQWDASRAAGFTTGDPWLPLAADFEPVNVAAERDDPRSMLTLVQRLLALRRAEPALAVGDYAGLAADEHVLIFGRRHGVRRLHVVLNLEAQPRRVALEGLGHVLLSTHLDRAGDMLDGAVELRADEGIVAEWIG
jgi:alpha-glucosidase